MKYLITGGAGYIGSCVSQFLIDKGHQVIILDNLSTGLKQNLPKKCKFYKVDIRNKKRVKKILKNNKIDVVMHFAAFINNEESILNPKKYFSNNFSNGRIFFSLCLENGINKIIYSSTAAVYGNKSKKVSEKDILKPMSPYPISKLKLEKYLEKNKKKISCVILRYFNVAGVDKKMRCGFNVNKGYNLILNLSAASIKNKLFLVNGNDYDTKDGTTIRDYIHVEDLAKIHLLVSKLVLRKKVFKIFNCGYGNGFSVMEILRRFNSISKKNIRFKVGKRRSSDIVISIANPKKLIKSTNWKPRFNNLTTIVRSSLNWYQKKWKKN